jgi:hypothetical protein
MLRALAYPFEVGFDLAVQLQAIATRAALKRFLNDIAAKLFQKMALVTLRTKRRQGTRNNVSDVDRLAFC